MNGTEPGLPAFGSESGYVEIGLIRRPVGLEGWCGVTPHGYTLAELAVPADVFTGVDSVSAVLRVVVDVRPHPRGLRCLFEGVNSVEEAGVLSGCRIFIKAEELPPAGDERFYHHQLRGMKAVSEDGTVLLGIITDVHNYPSVDALEIESASGEKHLIPMTNDAIVRIDIEAGKVILKANNINDLFD